MSDKYTNRLIHETSPYLLQHAHNPVDWHPWNNEALEKAKNEDKLLLISIGYSACHWCHVMEHESFENAEVAAVMNQNFVCIKVDREERPDVDQVYMDAVQLMTGQGGWPLNCFALPDGRPVYGGTYFRKTDWIRILKQMAALFTNEPEKLLKQANMVQEGVISQETAQVKDERANLSAAYLKSGLLKMAEGFDHQNGGFNGAPKFPMPSVLEYLLAFIKMNDEPTFQHHFHLTLEKMALGGIYDHAGGGFSRYSVDAQWHVPHFEKMLYDNAQLISIYSKAYGLNQNEHYKRVVYETLWFIHRELTSPDGAFYAALDADSEGVEGKYYVWTADELKYHLGENYPILAEYYSVTEEGNWEKGVNVLRSVATAEQFTLAKKISLNDFLSLLEMTESKLLSERWERTHPGLDDKIITSWNALMLKGYLDAYTAFHQDSLLDSALRSAHFIKDNLLGKDGSLYRSYKNGTARINGFLDDYSFTISAFIALYQVTFDEVWLNQALQFTEHVMQNFQDPESDFFFYTSAKDQPLAFRKKEMGDNVIPSSNSVMAENLMKLSVYFNRTGFFDKSLKMIRNMAYEVNSYGRFYSNWGRILAESSIPQKEIVITGPDAIFYAQSLKKQFTRSAVYAVSTNQSTLPIFEGRFVEGETMIYICENNTCKLPVNNIDDALRIINQEESSSPLVE